MSYNLIACPFCGCVSAEIRVIEYGGARPVCALVYCSGCDTEGPSTPGRYMDWDAARDEAARLWNTRAENSTSIAALERMRKSLALKLSNLDDALVVEKAIDAEITALQGKETP